MNIDNNIYALWIAAKTDEERVKLEQAAVKRNEIREPLTTLGSPLNPDCFKVPAEEVGF